MNATAESPVVGIAREELLAAFRGNIPPLPVPWHYRAGLFLVAVAMLLLPLVYLALIALTGYGVLWHLGHNAGIWNERDLGALAKLLMYFGPAVVGGLLILFMVKPLFARQARAAEPILLRPADEPLLFAFVERLCAAVGAPLPREIRMDCQVNASASLRRGLRSVLTNDLVLTIGLPLAAGLNLRQLAGVLAHEFGHFAQAAGMRMTFIIRSVNAWFARVVYERDGWDESLANASQRVDIRVGIILYIARFFIWVTRKILWALMHVGHWISCYMLRQMEYDADRYEALLGGSGTFAATSHRLVVLNVGSRAAHDNLNAALAEGRLADDFPGLLLARVNRFPAESLDQLRAESAKRKTKLFDTHPADADRIANVQPLGDTGLFHPPALPASVLFADFAASCRLVSERYYRDALGESFKASLLVPLADIESRNEQAEASAQARERFWLGQFTVLRPGLLARPLPAFDRDRLDAVRQQILAGKQEYAAALRAYNEADDKWLESLRARARRKVRSSEPAALVSQAAATPAMTAYEALLCERLLLALAATPAEQRGKAEKLFDPIAALAEALPELRKLRDEFAEIGAHLELLQEFPKNQELISAITTRVPGVAKQIAVLCQCVEGRAYPFDHADGEVTLRAFAFPSPLPIAEDVAGVINLTGPIINKLYTIYARGMADLAVIAEQAEATQGLAPLTER
jgi:Zn-dependent protease with chaperone function